jgi:hypothetical protein
MPFFIMLAFAVSANDCSLRENNIIKRAFTAVNARKLLHSEIKLMKTKHGKDTSWHFTRFTEGS